MGLQKPRYTCDCLDCLDIKLRQSQIVISARMILPWNVLILFFESWGRSVFRKCFESEGGSRAAGKIGSEIDPELAEFFKTHGDHA